MLGRLGFCFEGDVEKARSCCCSAEGDAGGLREAGCTSALPYSELPLSCSCSADIAAPSKVSYLVLRLCPVIFTPAASRAAQASAPAKGF